MGSGLQCYCSGIEINCGMIVIKAITYVKTRFANVSTAEKLLLTLQPCMPLCFMWLLVQTFACLETQEDTIEIGFRFLKSEN